MVYRYPEICQQCCGQRQPHLCLVTLMPLDALTQVVQEWFVCEGVFVSPLQMAMPDGRQVHHDGGVGDSSVGMDTIVPECSLGCWQWGNVVGTAECRRPGSVALPLCTSDG